GERQDLEADEDDQEVETADHERDAEVPPEEERVELAPLVPGALEVGLRDEDRDGRRAAEEEAHQPCQRRGLEAPVEGRAGRRGHQEVERGGDSRERQRREPPAERRQEGLEEEDETARRSERDLRQDREPVGLAELHEARVHGVPPSDRLPTWAS